MKVLRKISLIAAATFSVLVLIFNTGCASIGPELKSVNDAERMHVLDGSALSLDMTRIRDLPNEDVMSLTENMKAFVRQAVSRYRGQGEILNSILGSLISSNRLGLVYDGTASYTASETFKYKRANCLSFTTMIISMLRYAGLQAEFNDVAPR